MWYRQAQWASAQETPILGKQSGPAHLGSGQEMRIEAGGSNLQQVVSNFMQGSQPVFFTDANGQQYLIIHGSPAQDGEMYFDGGAAGSIRQDQLGEWMRSQGYDPGATKVIACHGGQIMTLDAPGITPAFDYTGQLELAAPADGSGDFLSIRGAQAEEINRRVYHGTPNDYEGVPLVPKRGKNGPFIFVAEDPETAKYFSYGKENVKEMDARIKNAFDPANIYEHPFLLKYVADWANKTGYLLRRDWKPDLSNPSFRKLIDNIANHNGNDSWMLESGVVKTYLRSKGYDSIVLQENGKKTYAIFDSKQLSLINDHRKSQNEAAIRCALSKEGRGKLDVDGVKVWVEYPKGSVRSGKGKDGKEWSRTMECDYGRIMGTKGADGDAIDVFLGGDLDSDKAFIIDQLNSEGNFDEHKCILGCGSLANAKKLYLANYPKDWKCGKVTEMSLKEFKKWLEKADKKKPASED